MERFKWNKPLYITMLVFRLRVYFVQFTHNSLCRTTTSFPSRSHECMNKSRLRPIATCFLWMWYIPAFVKKMFSLPRTLLDKFGPYTFYDGWHCINAFMIAPETFFNRFGETWIPFYVNTPVDSLQQCKIAKQSIGNSADLISVFTPYTHLLTCMQCLSFLLSLIHGLIQFSSSLVI